MKPVWLVTGDVIAFHTNVHIPTAVWRIKQVMRNNPQVTPLIPAENIEKLINLVAKSNCFEFKERRFHQIAGLVMGSPCSATIASLYLATVEKPLIMDYSYTIRNDTKVLTYSRYINDISVIYKGPKQVLDRFLRITNAKFPPLRVV